MVKPEPTPLKLAILYDYREESWPSMDLCAEMLSLQLRREHSLSLTTLDICPPFVRRFGSLPWLGKQYTAFNGDRLCNRYWDYPRYLRHQRDQFQLFHISDHSYAHLVHSLPPERTGVFCHDLDTFRCLLEPDQEPRPAWFRALSQRILTGMQQAAIVFYSTSTIRNQIEEYSLIETSRLIHAPYGISTEFSPEPTSISETLPAELLGFENSTDFILHVGTCIPRKRIDVLLDVFAALTKLKPQLKLVKVGGVWTESQQAQINQLGIAAQITHLQNLERHQIAELYRRAAVVLLTSEAEGFGLPLIEALACGAIVVASDIPVLREVGGAAAVYCPVGDLPTWVNTVAQLLAEPDLAPAAAITIAQAEKYSWSAHAATIAQAYLALV